MGFDPAARDGTVDGQAVTNGGGQTHDVSGGRDGTGFAHDFARGPLIEGGDGQATGHSLDRHQSERLVPAGREQEYGGATQFGG